MRSVKNSFKSVISIFILAGILTSCGSGSAVGSDTTAQGSNGDSVESSTPDQVTYTDDQRGYWEPLAAENLGGDFRVGVGTAGQFCIEAESGDVINDSIYQRNLAVETLYSVDIKEIVTDEKTVQAAILAGDDSYDIYRVSLYRNAANMATADLLTNVNSIKSLSLDSVWWDRNLIETTTISGKNFYLAGDIDYTLYGRTIAIFFNKSMMDELYDGDIYKLVTDGKWTYDVLDDLQRNATRDLNGDSKMDMKDSYGMICSAVHAPVLFSAAGGRIVTNNDGDFELTMNKGRNVDAITRIFEITLGASDYVFNTDKDSDQKTVFTRVLEMFRNNQALFQSTVLYNAINQRSMESDFGILPYPKFDETQDRYYATSYNGNAVYVIPKTVKDTERVGKIMNALAFEGRFTVKPAFYDEALGTKFIRDDESKEMLDIIFENIIFDVGFMYNLNGLGELLRNMHKSGDTNFASQFASKELAAKTALADLIEKISEMG